MKISRIVDLHAHAGWRVFSFLKIETDAGLIGWSEYNESYGSKGLTAVILKLAEVLIGQDPRPVELITANLYARTRQAPGGLIQQAIAAIENALVDVKAKALGVPVCEMLGGPVRDRLRLYWSHCGTYRLHHAEQMGVPPIRTLDDIRKLGEHVRERGFTALKTNIFLLDGGSPELYMPRPRRQRATLHSANSQRLDRRSGYGQDGHVRRDHLKPLPSMLVVMKCAIGDVRSHKDAFPELPHQT